MSLNSMCFFPFFQYRGIKIGPYIAGFLFSLGLFLSTTWVEIGKANAATAACTHYASPSGGGNGLSQGSPFQIANFWSVAGPGKTLCLLDGIYTGANSVIVPPSNVTGTSGNPITIRALNDGAVTLDGGGTITNLITLNPGNSWFIIRGMNAHGSGSGGVVGIGGNHNRYERIVAWDRSGGNGGVFQASGYGDSDNVLEDIAAFGMARYVLGVTQGADNTTVRRFWGMWEQPQSGMQEPNATIEAMYHGFNHHFENVIATWDGVVSAPNPYGIFNIIDHDTGHFIKGSIFYVKSGQNYNGGRLVGGGSCDTTIEHSVVYTEQSYAPFGLTGSTDPCTPNNHLTNTTEIGGTASSISSGWTISNRVDVDAVAQAPNIWNGAGNQGARVCKQYVNGTLTNNPLWPWPMDARIRAALIASGRNPDTIFGGTGNSVTQQMEQMFGPIPSECRTGSQLLAAPSGLSVTP